MTASAQFPRHADKQNSAFFEEYLTRLLEERDGVGLTDTIPEMEAIPRATAPPHRRRRARW